jgi:hypothetical protein
MEPQGEGICSSYSFTTSALDGVSGRRHALASLYPPVTIGQETGWAPELVWKKRLEEKSFFPLPGIEPQSPGGPARSQALY